jgi:hypothetical protein
VEEKSEVMSENKRDEEMMDTCTWTWVADQGKVLVWNCLDNRVIIL